MRPTLLTILSDRRFEAQSLGEIVARKYSQHMNTLTRNFSMKQWQISVVPSDHQNLLRELWESMEAGNMGIVTASDDDPGWFDSLAPVMSVLNPVSTLVMLGAQQVSSDISGVFQCSAHLPEMSLEDQYLLTNKVLKQARYESCEFEYAPASSDVIHLKDESTPENIH
jgi:hypothetical protein